MKVVNIFLLLIVSFYGILNEQISPKTYKMIFYYRYKEVLNTPSHPLLTSSYKNILLGPAQATIFASQTESSQVLDATIDTSKYIYTIRYKNIPLICYNHNFICTFNEFVNLYQVKYPEIKYEIPNEIVQFFGSKQAASINCAVLLQEETDNLEETAWVCHKEAKILFEFIVDISNRINLNFDNNIFSFASTYINDDDISQKGKTFFDGNNFMFVSEGKTLIQSNWDEIDSYSYQLNKIEKLVANPNNIESDRCLKFVRDEKKYHKFEYLCIEYPRTDDNMNYPINIAISKFFVGEIYTVEINSHILKSKAKKGIEAIKKSNKDPISIKVIWPILIKIRIDYLKCRHILVGLLKYNITPNKKFEKEIEKCKLDSIDNNCKKLPLCSKIAHYAIQEKMLVLETENYKYTYDLTNMYDDIYLDYQFSLSPDGKVEEKGKTYLDRNEIAKTYESLKKNKNCHSANNARVTLERQLDLIYISSNKDQFFQYLLKVNKYLN